MVWLAVFHILFFSGLDSELIYPYLVPKKTMNPTEFQDPYHGKEGVFQFTMNHLNQMLLFRCPADFDLGVNSIATGAYKYNIVTFAYALMDNHLHLLLGGRYEGCRAFYYWLIRRFRRMLSQRYGVSGVLWEDAYDVSGVTDDTKFLNEVAYILRNPYKARMVSPFSYPWSSADVYFNPQRDQIRGESFSGMKQERFRAIMQTHEQLPSWWEHANGRILNRCFVDYKTVEEKFGNSVTFFDRVRKYDLESVVQLSHGLAERLMFTDGEMQEKIRIVCQNEYHVSSHHQLDQKTLLLLARTLSRRFSSPKTQIGRLLGISDDILDSLL
jgi:hypothetical protein